MGRVLGATTLLTALLLLSLSVYPATLSTMTFQLGSTYEHRLDAVGSDAYHERLDDVESETGTNESAIPVFEHEALPPDVREVVDRTLDEDEGPDGTRRHVPVLCQDDALACPYPTRDELPEELAYGSSDGTYAAFVVETDEGRFLFTTPAVDPGPIPPAIHLSELWKLLFVPVFAAHALFLVAVGSEPFLGERRRLAAVGASAAGVVLTLGTDVLSAPMVVAGLCFGPAAYAPSPLRDRRVRAAAVLVGLAVAVVAVGPAYVLAYTDVSVSFAAQRVVVLLLGLGGPLVLYLLDRRVRTGPAVGSGDTDAGRSER